LSRLRWAPQVETAIEVGHIFKLGTRYSAAARGELRRDDASVSPLVMGSYGILAARVIAADR